MIIRTLLLLVAATATASALSEDNVNQQLDAAPGGKIIVDVDFGTIDVSAGADLTDAVWVEKVAVLILLACILALANAGNSIAARMAMIAMTTSSSISVKARGVLPEGFIGFG